MRGKYLFAGARNRPAAVTTGHLAAAAGITDDRDPGGHVFLEPRRAVPGIREVRAVLVNGNSGVRVRVDEPG